MRNGCFCASPDALIWPHRFPGGRIAGGAIGEPELHRRQLRHALADDEFQISIRCVRGTLEIDLIEAGRELRQTREIDREQAR
jgi:hypothetical protein